MNITQVARKLRWPAREWVGQCYAVAVRIVEAGLIEGVARYGHWRGRISDKCPIERWRGNPLGFVQHGWIETPDGNVADPTRWVFEAVRPYIYVGRPDHYDIGGDVLRAALTRPCPAYSAKAPRVILSVWKHSREAHDYMMRELFDRAPGITPEMVHWLANLPRTAFREHARPIFLALVEGGFGALIPTDNRKLVLGG